MPKSWASLYLAGTGGMAVVHVTGMTDTDLLPVPQRRDYFLFLFTLSARLGVELMRFYVVRVDLFAQLDLRVHPANDHDYGVLRAYTPVFQLGADLAF